MLPWTMPIVYSTKSGKALFHASESGANLTERQNPPQSDAGSI